MPAKPRLLVLTPDFPPARGGIQVLAQRLAAGMTGLDARVVTTDSPGAERLDADSDLAVRRVRADPPRSVPPARSGDRHASRGWRASGVGHALAGLQKISAAGEAQRHGGILFDQQNRRAIRVDRAQRFR